MPRHELETFVVVAVPGGAEAMAMVLTSTTRTIDDIIQRARALLPTLRERDAATEALGRLPDETVAHFSAMAFQGSPTEALWGLRAELRPNPTGAVLYARPGVTLVGSAFGFST